MSNQDLPYGVDVSAYQGQIDFEKLLPKIDFLAARATISWGYQDKWFEKNRLLSKGLPFIAYHVLYPGESADAQMDNLLRVAPPDEHIRYCIDSELDHGFGKARITASIRDVSNRLKAETGHYPIQYSRAGWLNQFVNIADLPDLDWWLAQYLRSQDGVPYTPEHPGPPTLPKGVNKWFMHQTGERGNGAEHGVPANANKFIDQNRFNGTKDDLLEYFGYKTEHNVYLPIIIGPAPGPEPVEPEPEPEPPKPEVIPAPVFAQRDPRWTNDRMNARAKIGEEGCLVTCTASGLSYLGYPITPKTLNALANSKGGYQLPNNLYWKFPEIITNKKILMDYDYYRWFTSGTGWQTMADNLLGNGRPVWAETKLNGRQHWVLLVAKQDGKYWAMDPWQGDYVDFSELYGDKIYRIAAYKKK